MRVCIFAPGLSLWSFGGVAEHTYQLSKHLVGLGCEVHVLCRTITGRNAHETVDGIQVHRIVPNRGPPWFFSLKKSVFDRFSKQWRFDLYHSQGPCGVFMQVDEPLLVTLHGTSANEAKEVFHDFLDMPRLGIWNTNAYVIHILAVPATYIPALFLKRIVKRATKIIAVSRFVKEESQKVLNAPAERIEVIYNGAQSRQVDTSKNGKENPLILFVGHLGVRKGLPYLMSALPSVFEENKNTKAAIIGDGPLKPLCQSMAKKLKISNRLTFTGVVTEKDKNYWYQKADMCVFPSTYEPFPMVVLEALAAGRPVIASNVGGIPEVIKDDVNGLLVRPRDPKQIAEAVNKILSDENLARKMSENAVRTIAEEFNWERIARKTLSIYRSCIGEAT